MTERAEQLTADVTQLSDTDLRGLAAELAHRAGNPAHSRPVSAVLAALAGETARIRRERRAYPAPDTLRIVVPAKGTPSPKAKRPEGA